MTYVSASLACTYSKPRSCFAVILSLTFTAGGNAFLVQVVLPSSSLGTGKSCLFAHASRAGLKPMSCVPLQPIRVSKSSHAYSLSRVQRAAMKASTTASEVGLFVGGCTIVVWSSFPVFHLRHTQD